MLYSELKSFREKRVIEDTRKQIGFERTELIAGYMRLYGYFDLFLEKFQYTLEDGMPIPSFFVIKNLLSERDTGKEEGSMDADRFLAIELSIEEENTTLSQDVITLKFLELVSSLNKICFEQEKKNLATDIDPNSSEYIVKRRELQEKAKTIGIKFN